MILGHGRGIVKATGRDKIVGSGDPGTISLYLGWVSHIECRDSVEKTMRRALAAAILGVWPATATAAVFTVGPRGTHASIQAAIDAASRIPGPHEIRVAFGTWAETLAVGEGTGAGDLVLTGGWTEDFLSRTEDATVTVVDGRGSAPVIDVDRTRGSLRVVGFTFTNGNAPRGVDRPFGGGMRLHVGGSAFVEIENDVFRENHLATPLFARGGGLSVQSFGAARVRLAHNRFENNTATAGDGAWVASGGGAQVTAQQQSLVDIVANELASNETASPGAFTIGTALDVEADDRARVNVMDNRIHDNHSTIGMGAPSGALSLNAGLGPSATAHIVARRNIVTRNPGHGHGQLAVQAQQERASTSPTRSWRRATPPASRQPPPTAAACSSPI
jgi:hypothetical protein